MQTQTNNYASRFTQQQLTFDRNHEVSLANTLSQSGGYPGLSTAQLAQLNQNALRQEWANTLLSTPPELIDSIKELIEASPQLEVSIADPAMRQEEVNANILAIMKGETAPFRYQDVDGELFINGARYEDIEQGRVGDCYFMASLAGLAATNPEYVENMITENGDGTYTVHFDGTLGDVTVDDDFVVDQFGNVQYAGTGDGGKKELWVAVIEKAYAQAKGGYEDIEGGWSYDAIAEMTGFGDFDVRPPGDFTAAEISAAVENGQFVTATSHSTDDPNKVVNENGIVVNHVYTIVGVRVVDGETQFLVYNPWGNTEISNSTLKNPGNESDDGAFWVSMDDINTNFRQVEVMNSPLPEAA